MAIQILSIIITQTHFTAKHNSIFYLRPYTFTFFFQSRSCYAGHPSWAHLWSGCHLIFFHRPIPPPSPESPGTWHDKQMLSKHIPWLPYCQLLNTRLVTFGLSASALVVKSVTLSPFPFKRPLGILNSLCDPHTSPLLEGYIPKCCSSLLLSIPLTSAFDRSTQPKCQNK